MAEPSGQQKSQRGYRRLLSQQFSFKQNQKKKGDATAAAEMGRSKGIKEQEITHPVIKLMLEEAPSTTTTKKKKATSKPEFLRYLEYVKEAGTWEANSDKPVIYFK